MDSKTPYVWLCRRSLWLIILAQASMGAHLCVGEAHVSGNKASGLAVVCVSLWGLVRGEGLSASIGVCV